MTATSVFAQHLDEVWRQINEDATLRCPTEWHCYGADWTDSREPWEPFCTHSRSRQSARSIINTHLRCRVAQSQSAAKMVIHKCSTDCRHPPPAVDTSAMHARPWLVASSSPVVRWPTSHVVNGVCHTAHDHVVIWR